MYVCKHIVVNRCLFAKQVALTRLIGYSYAPVVLPVNKPFAAHNLQLCVLIRIFHIQFIVEVNKLKVFIFYFHSHTKYTNNSKNKHV